MIEFSCPKCRRTMRAQDASVGKTGQCKTCGTAVTVPAADASQTLLAERKSEAFRQVAELIPEIESDNKLSAVLQPVQHLGTHVTGIQVNVQQPSRAAHSLGIASIILGSISLFVAWVPLLGLLATPLGVLALILGIIGFVIACVRKGSGIGFPIAGTAISIMALLIGFAVNYAVLSGPIEQAREAAHRSKERLKNGVDVADAAPREDHQDQRGNDKPADPWEAARMVAEDDSIRVEVESVTVGKVKLKDFSGEANSKDELLQIKVRITNTSDTKKLNYQTWSGRFVDSGSLRDDLDNSYKRISFGLGDTVVGQLRAESIYPSKSIVDL